MSKKKTQLLLLSCAKLSARACDAHAFSVQKRRSTTAFKGCISRLPPLSRSNMIYFFVHNSAFFLKTWTWLCTKFCSQRAHSMLQHFFRTFFCLDKKLWYYVNQITTNWLHTNCVFFANYCVKDCLPCSIY